MKIKHLAVIAISLAMAFYSCGSGEKSKGAENVDSKAEANAVIGYTNDLIDYLNSSGDWTRRNEDRLTAMINFMETKKKARYYLPIISSVNISLKKKDLKTAPSIMSEEEQVYFSQTMEKYTATYSSMVSSASTLHKYIQNEDYKDDDYMKGKAIADSIKQYYDYLTATKSELYKKIDVVTEKAEKIILEDHPLRDPILAMKGDLSSFVELYDVYYSYSEGKAKPAEVESAYQAVASSIETNKALYADILEENKVMSKYESFYSSCESSLDRYRKVLREVKANKRVRDNDFDSFNSSYNSMIGSYNRFVN